MSFEIIIAALGSGLISGLVVAFFWEARKPTINVIHNYPDGTYASQNDETTTIGKRNE